MFFKLQNFLNELQNSSQERKRRWLIGGTAAAMIFILAVWSFYITQTIKNLSSAGAEEKPSFAAVFNSGLKIVREELTSKIANLAGLNFVAEDLPKIEPKKLTQ